MGRCGHYRMGARTPSRWSQAKAQRCISTATREREREMHGTRGVTPPNEAHATGQGLVCCPRPSGRSYIHLCFGAWRIPPVKEKRSAVVLHSVRRYAASAHFRHLPTYVCRVQYSPQAHQHARAKTNLFVSSLDRSLNVQALPSDNIHTRTAERTAFLHPTAQLGCDALLQRIACMGHPVAQRMTIMSAP